VSPISKAGYQIYRLSDAEWVDRIKVDNWPVRTALYVDDRENGISLRLVDYSAGAIEPLHVHGGTHATTILKGRAIVDGETLGPLDVVLGPGNVPHGPLHYPDGCYLLSAMQGGAQAHLHSEVKDVAPTSCAVRSSAFPWERSADGSHEEKTLVDDVAGRLQVQALRFAPGATVEAHAHPHLQAGLILEGSAEIEGERLGVWDLVYAARGESHGPMSFPEGALVLALNLR
jgi:anti-sigma factor ChrR (cupin superfamily)